MTTQRSPPKTLLLLPPPPSPASYAAVKAAYHAPLITLLRSLNDSLSQSSQSPSTRSILSIAIPCPHLWNGRNSPRGSLFAHTQDIVKNVYKLVVIISAANGYNVEGVEGIDTRILLVAWPKGGRYESGSEEEKRASWGPLLFLQDVANASHLWTEIYSVESEEGEQVTKDFLTYARSKGTSGAPKVKKLRAGTSLVQSSGANTPLASETVLSGSQARRHLSVANGGTYDHLHIGHKLLLTMTAFTIDRPPLDEPAGTSVLTIGITAADLLANKKYAEHLETWHERYEIVHSFLCGIYLQEAPLDIQEIKNEGPNGHMVVAKIIQDNATLEMRYVEIWDPCGPTITDGEISALVLSEETRSGGQFVNNERAKKNMSELEVFEVGVVDAIEETENAGQKEPSATATAFESKLSSTEIRKAKAEATAKARQSKE